MRLVCKDAFAQMTKKLYVQHQQHAKSNVESRLVTKSNHVQRVAYVLTEFSSVLILRYAKKNVVLKPELQSKNVRLTAYAYTIPGNAPSLKSAPNLAGFVLVKLDARKARSPTAHTLIYQCMLWGCVTIVTTNMVGPGPPPIVCTLDSGSPTPKVSAKTVI